LPARRVTLVPKVEHSLAGKEPGEATLDPVEFLGLDIEPAAGEAVLEGDSTDPVKVTTTAFIDLPDGTQVQRTFETFHVGDYTMRRNVTPDGRGPLVTLRRPPQNPWVPEPDPNLKINRKDFKVYALLGNMSRVLGVEEAIRSIPDSELTIGYHPGFLVGMTGLTDFPYDYERLFDCRAVVVNNSVLDVARYVGMSVLERYLKRGGGLVYGGGDNVFGMTRCNYQHPAYDFIPVAQGARIVKETARVNSPAAGHPIFTGVDLSNLPYVYYVQKVALKPDLPAEAKVLLKVGDDPLIIQYDPVPGQRTITTLVLPFGDPEANPGKPHIVQWPEWRKLYANIVRYVAQDL